MGLVKVIWEVLKTFFRETSIAGLNNAAKSKSHIRRGIWSFIFCFLLVFTVQGIFNTVKEYLEYPILTNVNVTRVPAIEFPALTVCNMNRLHCSNLVTIWEKMIAKGESEEEKIAIEDLTTLLNLTKCKNQICSTLSALIPPIKFGPLGKDTDYILFRYANFGCNTVTPSLTMLVCHQIRIIEEQSVEEGNDTFIKLSREAWSAGNCTVNQSCSYKLPQEVRPLTAEEFKKPSFCTGNEFVPSLLLQGHDEKTSMPYLKKLDEEAKFIKHYLNLPKEIQTLIGQRFLKYESDIIGVKRTVQGLILSCSYQGQSCLNHSSSWVQLNLPKYGNCYTFNSYKRPYSRLSKTSNTGASNSLEIEFNLDQENYMNSKLSENAGVRLVIHDPAAFPYPDEFGIDLQPGTSTSVAIQKHFISRLPDPYKSKCFKSWKQTSYKNASQEFPVYTLAACHRICLQLSIQRECSCIHPYITEGLLKNDKRAICDIKPNATLNKDFKCFSKIMENFSDQMIACKCNIACDETEYVATSTTSYWPSNLYWETLADTYGLIDPSLPKLIGSLKEKVRNRLQINFLRVQAYFKTLNVRIVNEIPKYSDESFVAGLGGSLSLYLGIAIIMVFEIVELFYDIFIAVWHYIMKNKKSVNLN